MTKPYQKKKGWRDQTHKEKRKALLEGGIGFFLPIIGVTASILIFNNEILEITGSVAGMMISAYLLDKLT